MRLGTGRRDDDRRRIADLFDDTLRLVWARKHHRRAAKQALQFLRGAGGADAHDAHPSAAAMRAMPIDGRRATPAAARGRLWAAAFEGSRAAQAARLTQALRAYERFRDAVGWDREQDRTSAKRHFERAHGRMRHAGADARVGETCEFVAVEPPYGRRRRARRVTVRHDRRARSAYGDRHRRRVFAFPCAQDAARIRVCDEHTIVQPRAQAAHAARVRVGHESVGVLIGAVIEHGEQGRPGHRRIHRRARADDATHMPGTDGEIRAVTLRLSDRRTQYGDVPCVPAVVGIRRIRVQSGHIKRMHELPHLAHAGHDEHGRFAVRKRAERHPCEAVTCRPGDAVDDERLKTVGGERVRKDARLLVATREHIR